MTGGSGLPTGFRRLWTWHVATLTEERRTATLLKKKKNQEVKSSLSRPFINPPSCLHLKRSTQRQGCLISGFSPPRRHQRSRHRLLWRCRRLAPWAQLVQSYSACDGRGAFDLGKVRAPQLWGLFSDEATGLKVAAAFVVGTRAFGLRTWGREEKRWQLATDRTRCWPFWRHVQGQDGSRHKKVGAAGEGGEVVAGSLLHLNHLLGVRCEGALRAKSDFSRSH